MMPTSLRVFLRVLLSGISGLVCPPFSDSAKLLWFFSSTFNVAQLRLNIKDICLNKEIQRYFFVTGLSGFEIK